MCPPMSTVRRWIKKYEAEGESAFNLKPTKPNERKKKPSATKSKEPISLEEEVKLLRAEVDYLKKAKFFKEGVSKKRSRIVRFTAIHQLSGTYSIKLLCRIAEVSRSWLL